MLLALLAPVGLAACTESNQSRSRKIAATAQTGESSQKATTIARRSTDVEVRRAAVLSGDGGTTVVALQLTNRGPSQANVPVLFGVYGRGKKPLYRNNVAGLQESLRSVGSIGASATVWWVNDQLPGATGAKRVRAEVGAAQTGRPLPAVKVDPGQVVNDPSGEFLVGTVVNDSKGTLAEVPIYAVGLSGGKVVAAGRAIIAKLPVGAKAKATYRILLTGDPSGAKFSVYAAPKPI